MAIFQVYWSTEAKDDGSGGDCWSYKLCKATIKSPPTNQHPVFYRPDALPVTQPTVSKHWMEKYRIPWTCLPQAHLGVFQLCLWPLIAPGYLGEGCHASHQPSDASTPAIVRILWEFFSCRFVVTGCLKLLFFTFVSMNYDEVKVGIWCWWLYRNL